MSLFGKEEIKRKMSKIILKMSKIILKMIKNNHNKKLHQIYIKDYKAQLKKYLFNLQD